MGRNIMKGLAAAYLAALVSTVLGGCATSGAARLLDQQSSGSQPPGGSPPPAEDPGQGSTPAPPTAYVWPDGRTTVEWDPDVRIVQDPDPDSPFFSIVVEGVAHEFDQSQEVPFPVTDGLEAFTEEADGDWTFRFFDYGPTFDGRGKTALVVYDGPSQEGGAPILAGHTLIREGSAPTIPTSGVATFDSLMSGVIRYGATPGDEMLVGRGTVSVDFGARALEGAFSDIDFLVSEDFSGATSEATRLGHDFGVAMTGTVHGENLSLEAWTIEHKGTGAFIDMSGVGSGQLLGSPGRNPSGITGIIGMSSPKNEPPAGLMAGFEGVCVCFKP